MFGSWECVNEQSKFQAHLVFKLTNGQMGSEEKISNTVLDFLILLFLLLCSTVPGIISLKLCFLAHVSLTWRVRVRVCIHTRDGRNEGGKELKHLKASTPDWPNPGTVAAKFHPNL